MDAVKLTFACHVQSIVPAKLGVVVCAGSARDSGAYGRITHLNNKYWVCGCCNAVCASICARWLAVAHVLQPAGGGGFYSPLRPSYVKVGLVALGSA